MFKTDKSKQTTDKKFVSFQDNKQGFLLLKDVKSTDKAS